MKRGQIAGPFGWISFTVVLLFLILVTTLLSANVWYQTSLKAPGGGSEKIFVVKNGEAAVEIAKRLEEEGLIKNSLAFRIYLFTTKNDGKIEVGTFKLNSNRSAEELVQSLQQGRVDKWVTLVEGLRVEEVADKLKGEFDIEEKKFISLSEEGYMFPDTYLMPVNADEAKITKILKENFDKKIDQNIIAQAKKNGLSLSELINLASIVERESRNTDERPIIAGILLKRLREGIRLEADATIQYALGFQNEQKTWWKKDLTFQDIDIKSPYNTRKVASLPPGPICNPGLSAIKAVADPKVSPYYYYIHDGDGAAHFAATLDEHNANISKYL
ncbi:MAG: endolytic transglycosylase MltG [Candidatus Woykebacteria bacterium]